MKDRKMSFYNRIVKRILDIICSFAAIVCLSIVYLPICVIIKCTSEGPVFFKQKRVGKNKKYWLFVNSRGKPKNENELKIKTSDSIKLSLVFDN